MSAVLSKIESPNLTIIGPQPTWFDAEGYSRLVDGGRLLYKDDNHLSARGADIYFRAALEPVFDQIAGRVQSGTATSTLR